jgi:hypothetical protein
MVLGIIGTSFKSDLVVVEGPSTPINIFGILIGSALSTRWIRNTVPSAGFSRKMALRTIHQKLPWIRPRRVWIRSWIGLPTHPVSHKLNSCGHPVIIGQEDQTRDDGGFDEHAHRCMESHLSVNERPALRGIRNEIRALFGKRPGVDLEPAFGISRRACDKRFLRVESGLRSLD